MTKIQSALDKIDPSVVQPDGKPYQLLLPVQLFTANDDSDLPEAVASEKDEDMQNRVSPVIEEAPSINPENVAYIDASEY